MSDSQLRELTDEEIAALKNALATVLLRTKKLSIAVDNVPSADESVRDKLHSLNARERTIAECLIDLLDRAISVRFELED